VPIRADETMRINNSLILSERRLKLIHEFLYSLILEWSWLYPNAATTHINFAVSLATEEGFKPMASINEQGDGEPIRRNTSLGEDIVSTTSCPNEI
jgi:hypothetical protein